MAKKKSKKIIKLNNKIREIFGGVAFDEAVTTLPDDVLTELSLVADLDIPSLDRDTIVRALRRVWSEGKYHDRNHIVSYLSAKYKGGKTAQPPKDSSTQMDKVGKIVSILDELKHTPQEAEAILERYVDIRTTKITPQKIANTLHYMRINERFANLEKELDVSFSTLGEMEFYHKFSFGLPEYDFSKNLLVASQGLGLDNLMQNNDDDEILSFLCAEKNRLVAQKQNEINKLIFRLYSHPHPYLSNEQIESHLRKMPPDVEPSHISVDIESMKSIVKQMNGGYVLLDLGEQYAVECRKEAHVHNVSFDYKIRVAYDRSYLDSLVWRGVEPLPVVSDLESVDQQALQHFENALQEIFLEAKEMTSTLEISNEVIWKHIHQFLDPQLASGDSLNIKRKTLRRILYHFGEYLKPLREKKMREELLAKTIRDFKNLFPLARSLDRKIIFYAGPTNSGKTYNAMTKLREAQTGYYLAPLRLLALEGYESMREKGVTASLITGEEEIIDEDSTHISSTIEMLNFEVDVECCVIDEIQMIADRDRGWAWANALIGAPAKTVVLTGSADAISSVSELAAYLGEELEVVYFERKNPLEVMSRPTRLKSIKPSTAIVAFSRKEVLSYKQRLSSHHNVSVIYGNLSPEVRREEARKFREGESDVLIATDAIAMGLNLPIQTLLFARDNKFDGLRRRELATSEILQIAGRAGRYGMHEHGFIGALDAATLQTIEGKFHDPLPDIELPFSVMASLHHVELIGEILETENLLDILTFFADNMEFEGPFRAANIESMLEIAAIVDEYELDLRSRYHLATAPVSINSPYIESAFHRYIKHLERGEIVPYYAPRDLPSHAHTNEELLRAEDRVKEVSLYLWLGFRFADKFPDIEAAIEARTRLNRFIEKSLAKGDFVKRCKRCGKTLDFSYRYSICESCYRKGKQGVHRRKDRKK